MAVAVRAARESDLDAVIALDDIVRELHAALYPEDFALQADRDAVKARFAALLHETGHALIVAEADGAVAGQNRGVVGYAWTELQIRPPSPFYNRRDRIYVHHLAVAPQARRQGVAAALFHHIEQRAAAQGVADVYLESWAANKAAHAFFAAQGFTHLKYMFRKRLV
jgi:ribosomal protein S18 acetylase RimI-like enzyme